MGSILQKERTFKHLESFREANFHWAVISSKSGLNHIKRNALPFAERAFQAFRPKRGFLCNVAMSIAVPHF
jgi:septum formation inhibitor-activating ATPase MinD